MRQAYFLLLLRMSLLSILAHKLHVRLDDDLRKTLYNHLSHLQFSVVFLGNINYVEVMAPVTRFQQRRAATSAARSAGSAALMERRRIRREAWIWRKVRTYSNRFKDSKDRRFERAHPKCITVLIINSQKPNETGQ